MWLFGELPEKFEPRAQIDGRTLDPTSSRADCSTIMMSWGAGVWRTCPQFHRVDSPSRVDRGTSLAAAAPALLCEAARRGSLSSASVLPNRIRWPGLESTGFANLVPLTLLTIFYLQLLPRPDSRPRSREPRPPREGPPEALGPSGRHAWGASLQNPKCRMLSIPMGTTSQPRGTAHRLGVGRQRLRPRSCNICLTSGRSLSGTSLRSSAIAATLCSTGRQVG